MMRQLLMRRPHLGDLPQLPDPPPGYALRDFRKDSADDHALIARLLASAFADPSWSAARAREAFVLDGTVRRTVLAVHSGMPAGIHGRRDGDTAVATASARLMPEAFPGSGYIHWVATDPAHGGKRLGWLVSLAVLHGFAALGCTDAVLETDDHRLPALKTYLALGFEPWIRDESHPARWDAIRARLSDVRS